MPVTIKVNGVANSLVHKGSGGVSAATIPDVCKTPSPGGPVPIPYPNVSQSATLVKGTTTIRADGMMAANKGSEFALSNGDEPGTLGGVKSSTFMKESSWITYSFDVKLQGKGAARLTDKKFQNHQNTVDMAGVLQEPVDVFDEFAKIVCPKFCALVKRMEAGEKLKPGETWTRKLKGELAEHADELARLGVKFEKSAVVAAVKGSAEAWGRKAITKFGKSFGAKLFTKAIPVVGWAMAAYDIYDAATLVKQGYDLMRVRPDFVLGDGKVGDIKFPGDDWLPGQKEAYTALNGDKPPKLINKENCKC